MWEKKKKGIIECYKRIVKCDVEIAQYEDKTVKCGKKEEVKKPH